MPVPLPLLYDPCMIPIYIIPRKAYTLYPTFCIYKHSDRKLTVLSEHLSDQGNTSKTILTIPFLLFQ